MVASQESSLLFSLKELEALEQGRVEGERARAAARREADRRALLERERLAKEAESRRIEEQERKRRVEDARRRETEDRRVAIERAAVEHARAEVEARSRAELARARDAHEIELENARSRGARRLYRLLLGMNLIATVALAAFAVALSGELRHRERRDAARSDIEDRERAQHRRTERALYSASTEVDELQHRLEALRGSVNPPPSAAPPAGFHGKPSPSKEKGRPPRAALLGRPCGLDGDPLDGCLPSR